MLAARAALEATETKTILFILLWRKSPCDTKETVWAVDVETLPIDFFISVVADVQTEDISTESSTFLREL